MKPRPHTNPAPLGITKKSARIPNAGYLKIKAEALIRLYETPQAPLTDAQGQPTRYAMQARQYGEHPPRNLNQAQALVQRARQQLAQLQE